MTIPIVIHGHTGDVGGRVMVGCDCGLGVGVSPLKIDDGVSSRVRPLLRRGLEEREATGTVPKERRSVCPA